MGWKMLVLLSYLQLIQKKLDFQEFCETDTVVKGASMSPAGKTLAHLADSVARITCQ